MNQLLPQKLRRFQFTLGQLLALTLGVALGFAPLKVWELTARAKPHVFVELKLLEVPVAEVPAMGLSLAKNGLISVQLKSGSDDWTKVRDVKVVAEPVLATLSGRPTSFNVGGDVPVPVTDKNGLTSIEYREYGTHVDVLPTILRNGRIEMEIVTKVSSVTMPPDGEEGSTLPAFHSASSSTKIEVPDGRTVVFGGLQMHPEEKPDRGAWVFIVTVRTQKSTLASLQDSFMEPDEAQETSERDQLWASLRALRPEIDQLAAGKLEATERQARLILILARVVGAEMDFRTRDTEAETEPPA